jgi:hypothetical protein
LLVAQSFKAAYQYAADDRLLITRPQGLREIHALKALRTGRWDSPRATEMNRSARRLQKEVKDMLEGGWRRSNAGFNDVKERIWKENDAVLVRSFKDED